MVSEPPALVAPPHSRASNDMMNARTAPLVGAGGPVATYDEVVGQLSKEAQEYMCYLPDGRLLISKTHRFKPVVTSFIGRLRRLQMPYREQHVDLSVITSMQEEQRASQSAPRDASDMQRFARQLLEKAVAARASDIHLRCSKVARTSIHMRIHGDIEFVDEHPFEFGERLATAIYQSIADVSDTSFEPLSRQDARIGNKAHLPVGLDGVRVATTPQVDGFIMVLRLLYNDTVDSFELTLLGYSTEQAEAVELMKRRPTGINIIAGPTGSGKSTTLQRVLGSIVKETAGRKHVITVEDPPEYPIPGVVQTPVTNAGTEEERSESFQTAIKAAMRLDPDVIMIGEVRDAPSATLAVRAAMTGHQVWTTLHTNSAIGSIYRLHDLGVPLEIITDHTIITGLTCQRLIKVLCPHCKVPFSNAIKRYREGDVRRILSVVALESAYVTGEGCEHCRGTGTIGRTVVAETIITDATLMSLIRQRDRIGAYEYWKRDQNGKTMLSHAIAKINDGSVDPFTAEDVVGPLNMETIEADHRINSTEVKSAVTLAAPAVRE